MGVRARCRLGRSRAEGRRQTTIMAVAYEGGVVLGADSRTSTGETTAARLRSFSLRVTAPLRQALTLQTEWRTRLAAWRRTSTSAAPALCAPASARARLCARLPLLQPGQPAALAPASPPLAPTTRTLGVAGRRGVPASRRNPSALRLTGHAARCRLPTRKPSQLSCATTSTSTGAAGCGSPRPLPAP